MTEKLRTLLDERASALEFTPPDLAAVRAAGRRRRHRRRAVAAGGSGLLAAAAAVAAVAVLPVGHERTASEPDGATAVDAQRDRSVDPVLPPSYATGRTIRALSGRVVEETGNPIEAYVDTRDGFVFVNDSGVVFAVSADGLTLGPVGNTDPRSPRLVADPATSLVGWVDPTESDDPAFVVLDQSTGSRQVLDADTEGMDYLADELDPAAFYALDGGTAYVRDRSGAVAVDVATGQRRPLGPTRSGFDIVGARDGRLVFDTEEGLAIGPTLDRPEVRLDGDYSSLAVFSPDGRYLSLDADTATVVDAATGEPVGLDVGGGDFSVGWRWLDVDSLAVLTLEGRRVDVLDCAVPSGQCEVLQRGVTDLAALENGDFLLPSGLATTE